MSTVGLAFVEAARMIARADPKLVEIVALSLGVSLGAVALATLVALPLGAAIAVTQFTGRQAAIVLLNALRIAGCAAGAFHQTRA